MYTNVNIRCVRIIHQNVYKNTTKYSHPTIGLLFNLSRTQQTLKRYDPQRLQECSVFVYARLKKSRIFRS